ncbi:MAG: sugar transferase [Marmoricola sp.]
MRRQAGAAARMRWFLVGVFVVDLFVMVEFSWLAWSNRDWLAALWSRPDTTMLTYSSIQPWAVGLWVFVLLAAGTYETRNFGVSFDDFRAILLGCVVSVCLVGFVGFVSPGVIPRSYPLLMFGLGTPALLIVHYLDRRVLHFLRRRGYFVRRTVAVGSGAAVAALIAVFARVPWTGYRVVGLCVPAGEQDVGLPDAQVLGSAEDVRRVATEHHADAVLVASGAYSSPTDLKRIGWELEGLGLEMLVTPTLTDVAGPRIHMGHVAGLPLLHVDEPLADRAGGASKRIFDLVVTSAVLAVLAVPMLLVALVVKLYDRGPVFYRQQRIGVRGRSFSIIKFRSMVPNAATMMADLAEQNDADVRFKMKADPRVTPFGRFIRKFSIDELPQLFNVVAGDMSLVGPRPQVAAEVDLYEEHIYRRLLVRPGMTGLWQVSGRADLSWEESMRLDLYYVDNWTMIGDLAIMVKTVRAVLFSHGAY